MTLIECHECGGRGEVIDAPCGEGRAYVDVCPVCKGSGLATPEHEYEDVSQLGDTITRVERVR